MGKKEDLRFTLNRLYNCRDLEISNLWQRSVFLSVFLILCFTAYGYLALELVNKLVGPKKIISDDLLLLSTICLFITVVGTTFSLVWILMAKGSKAWYEVYETAIHKFENAHYKKLKLPYDNIMGNMGLESRKKNENIFSTKSGSYSTSRINIAIGQITLVLWIILSIIHLIFNFYYCEIFDKYFWFNIALTIIDILILYFIVISEYLKSSFLKD